MGLPEFEGRAVVRSAVKITRAGDGLSEALKLEPTALHHGDEVFFVLRGAVTQVNHRPNSREEDDLLVRVHTVEAQEIAMVGHVEVDNLLAAERDRVKRLKDEEAGREPLPLDEEPQGAHKPSARAAGGDRPSGGRGRPATSPAPEGPEGPPPTGPPLEDYDTATVEDIVSAVAVFDAEQVWMTVEWEEAHEDRKEVTTACFARLDALGAD
jgi:hypothetical protein